MQQNGAELIGAVRAWLRRYVWFPVAGQDLIIALWIAHTWFIDGFTSTPYLCVTARTKRAGKTTLLELVAAAGQNGQTFATIRPAAIVRFLHAVEGRAVVAFDEVERMSRGTAGDVRSILATGYRRGQFHMVTSGDRVKAFRVFGPKAFALIGDMTDVIRDRSVILRLQRAPRGAEVLDYTNPTIRERAHTEAAELAAELSNWQQRTGGKSRIVSPEFLDGREREIWLPIWSMAHHAGLDAKTMDLLAAAMVDTSAIKSEPASAWTALSEDAERDQEDQDYAERMLTDLRSVLKPGETFIPSVEAVVRLQGIPTAIWRTWRGQGVNEITLAALLSRFGLAPVVGRIGKGRKGSRTVRGYKVRDVQAVKL